MYNSYLLLKGVINFLSICWLLSRRTIIHVRVHSIRMELVARKRSYRLVFVSRRRVAAVWCCANVEITRIVERAARWRCLRVFVDRTVLRCLKIKKIFVDFNFFYLFDFDRASWSFSDFSSWQVVLRRRSHHRKRRVQESRARRNHRRIILRMTRWRIVIHQIIRIN